MTRESTEGGSSGRITTGIGQDTLVLKIINFVRRQLPLWRDDPQRPFEESEHKLNPQLCDFLDSRNEGIAVMVRFKHEEPQSGRSSVDLSAKLVEGVGIEVQFHSIYEPILVFECKRLPPPRKDREKEYVTGGMQHRTGGIQRFKLGIHGAALNLVVMIGYIQKRTASDWHREINGWISQLCSGLESDGCVWNEKETLEPLEENSHTGVASCRSIHKRTTNQSSNEIEIHHLWITMTMQQS